MSEWHGGKGSKQRPTDKQLFDSNWDKIFKKHNDTIKWEHRCSIKGLKYIPYGEKCQWCGDEEVGAQYE